MALLDRSTCWNTNWQDVFLHRALIERSNVNNSGVFGLARCRRKWTSWSPPAPTQIPLPLVKQCALPLIPEQTSQQHLVQSPPQTAMLPIVTIHPCPIAKHHQCPNGWPIHANEWCLHQTTRHTAMHAPSYCPMTCAKRASASEHLYE